MQPPSKKVGKNETPPEWKERNKCIWSSDKQKHKLRNSRRGSAGREGSSRAVRSATGSGTGEKNQSVKPKLSVGRRAYLRVNLTVKGGWGG